ncbi:hypothetical protein [Leptospira stimsonii]|uniref:hypothetical protein n=1 Tax=Leptospira stimsonii TaxID=2202203 RepID=UPI0019D5B3B6|nr:hypothetical protein [Leptospira stimsonii]
MVRKKRNVLGSFHTNRSIGSRASKHSPLGWKILSVPGTGLIFESVEVCSSLIL